jgi:hypothetical protein
MEENLAWVCRMGCLEIGSPGCLLLCSFQFFLLFSYPQASTSKLSRTRISQQKSNETRDGYVISHFPKKEESEKTRRREILHKEEQKESIPNFENQMSQMATAINRLEAQVGGKLLNFRVN